MSRVWMFGACTEKCPLGWWLIIQLTKRKYPLGYVFMSLAPPSGWTVQSLHSLQQHQNILAQAHNPVPHKRLIFYFFIFKGVNVSDVSLVWAF